MPASACTNERENTRSIVLQNAFRISELRRYGAIKREMQELATAGFEVPI
jgi:hypothetical protein